jgi:hypothetical protein
VTSDVRSSVRARDGDRTQQQQSEFPSFGERAQALASVSQRSLPAFTAGVRSRRGSQTSSARSRAASVTVGSFGGSDAPAAAGSYAFERSKSFSSQSKESAHNVHARRPSTVAREPSAVHVGSGRDVAISDDMSSVAGFPEEIDKMTKIRTNAQSLVIATRTLFGLTSGGAKTGTALGGLLTALSRWKEAATELKSRSIDLAHRQVARLTFLFSYCQSKGSIRFRSRVHHCPLA